MAGIIQSFYYLVGRSKFIVKLIEFRIIQKIEAHFLTDSLGHSTRVIEGRISQESDKIKGESGQKASVLPFVTQHDVNYSAVAGLPCCDRQNQAQWSQPHKSNQFTQVLGFVRAAWVSKVRSPELLWSQRSMVRKSRRRKHSKQDSSGLSWEETHSSQCHGWNTHNGHYALSTQSVHI